MKKYDAIADRVKDKKKTKKNCDDSEAVIVDKLFYLL